MFVFQVHLFLYKRLVSMYGKVFTDAGDVTDIVLALFDYVINLMLKFEV